MEILTEGVNRSEVTYKETCPACAALFSFKEKEADSSSLQHGIPVIRVTCPCCGYRFTLKAHLFGFPEIVWNPDLRAIEHGRGIPGPMPPKWMMEAINEEFNKKPPLIYLISKIGNWLIGIVSRMKRRKVTDPKNTPEGTP